MLKPLILVLEGVAIGVLGTLLIQDLTRPVAAPEQEVLLEVCEVDWNEPKDDYTAGCEFEPPDNFEEDLIAAAEEAGINPRVLALTVWRESDCNAAAVGSSGEIGLTQINPSVWRKTLTREGFGDLSDPSTNLRAGAWILARLKARSRTDIEAVRRYNGSGPKARRYAEAQRIVYLATWGDELEI